MDYDVLVIGAGPAGSRTAFNLASRGCKVAVLEKHDRIGHKLACTGIIGRECFEVFDIERDCVLQEARSAKLFAPSGEFIRISRDETQAYIVDRPLFDRSLARKARNAGAEYLLSSQVNDIAVSAEGVELTVNQQGNTTNLTGKAAIIASGFSSSLPPKLGMGNIKYSITGAQAEVQSRGIEETEVYFSNKTAPGFFAWLVPISEHRARAGLFALRKPGAYLQDFLGKLVAEGKITDSKPGISYGGIPLKPIPRSYAERVLVVGDAAGQVKPTTGGGIYYGLICADFASETIGRAFEQNDFSAKQFSRYEKLWKAKLGKELRIDYFARRLYNRLSDKRINSIFSIVRDNNIHEDLLNSSYRSFDWHGELVMDGLKRLTPWWQLFGHYFPSYVLKSLRSRT